MFVSSSISLKLFLNRVELVMQAVLLDRARRLLVVKSPAKISPTFGINSLLLVLERMTKGESNKQIAYNLDIAETTVKAHVSAILRKLNVHNRVQAILSAGDIDFTSYLRR